VEKQKNAKQHNKNNVVIGILILVLFAVTGILPLAIKLFVGVIGLGIGLIAGFIGLIIGLLGAVIGLVFGLLPMVIMIGVVVFALKAINGEAKFVPVAKSKRKNDEDYI
jgi:hypothetical protein